MDDQWMVDWLDTYSSRRCLRHASSCSSRLAAAVHLGEAWVSFRLLLQAAGYRRPSVSAGAHLATRSLGATDGERSGSGGGSCADMRVERAHGAETSR